MRFITIKLEIVKMYVLLNYSNTNKERHTWKLRVPYSQMHDTTHALEHKVQRDLTLILPLPCKAGDTKGFVQPQVLNHFFFITVMISWNVFFMCKFRTRTALCRRTILRYHRLFEIKYFSSMLYDVEDIDKKNIAESDIEPGFLTTRK